MGGMFNSCMKTNQIEEEADQAVKELEKQVPKSHLQERTQETEAQQLNFEQNLTEKILLVDFEFFLFQKKELIDGFYHVLHMLEYDQGTVPIDLNIAKQFASEVCIRYFDNPYHNFNHGFSVFQWTFAIQHNYGIFMPLISKDQFLAHLISCLAHDVEHPGVNNAFLIAQQHELAKRYNDVSVLENHHGAVLFQLLSQPRTNLLQPYEANMQKDLRKQMIQSILATDMARHFQVLENFQKLNKDYTQPQSKQSFLDFMLHIADISNPTQTWDVYKKWALMVIKEFTLQTEKEAMIGIPVTVFMAIGDDLQKIKKSQIGFIDNFIGPTFKVVVEAFPVLNFTIVNLNENKKKWEEAKEV